MSAKRFIGLRAFNSSSKAADKIADLPSLFPVGLLLDVVWFRRIRRVLFRNDFVELIFLNGFLFTIC